jgi:hypothetical protein
MDLRKIISYNNYEGFRVGFGGLQMTGFKKFQNWRVFLMVQRRNFKYNIGLSTRVGKFSDSWIILHQRCQRDCQYFIWHRKKPLNDPRPINISFYNYVSWKAIWKHRLFLKRKASGHSIEITPKFNYVYNLNGRLYSITSWQRLWFPAVESFQWLYANTDWQSWGGEGFQNSLFSIHNRHKVLGNDFQFSKIDFKTEFEKKYLNGQKQIFEAGFAIGDIPLTHL